tara:strand:- start:12517 stop:13539 length:1023 start_codon:yes stop_codon:yes gene_type:complete
VALIFGFVRAILPFLILLVVNLNLKYNLDNYTGSVQDIDLSFLKGKYQINNLKISKKTQSSNSPFIDIQNINIFMDYQSLKTGLVRFELFLESPKLFFKDSADESKKDDGKNEAKSNWIDTIESIIPVDIDQIRVRNGYISFQNIDIANKNEIFLKDIEMKVNDIYTKDLSKSSLSIKAKSNGNSDLSVHGLFGILHDQPIMDLNYSLRNFSITEINKLLMKYIPLDFSSGELTLIGEYVSHKDVKAYTNFFFKDLDVIATEQSFKNTSHILYEFASGLYNWLLKNRDNSHLAFTLPYEYKKDKWEFDFSKVFWSSLKNKFDSMEPKLENKLDLSELSQK